MAILVKKDEKINIPNEEIVAIKGEIQLGRPVVRVICKQFDRCGRELLLNN